MKGLCLFVCFAHATSTATNISRSKLNTHNFVNWENRIRNRIWLNISESVWPLSGGMRACFYTCVVCDEYATIQVHIFVMWLGQYGKPNLKSFPVDWYNLFRWTFVSSSRFRDFQLSEELPPEIYYYICLIGRWGVK